MKNAPIVAENEKQLFVEVAKYLQIEKNIRKAKINKVFSHLGDVAAQLIKESTPASKEQPGTRRKPEQGI